MLSVGEIFDQTFGASWARSKSESPLLRRITSPPWLLFIPLSIFLIVMFFGSMMMILYASFKTGNNLSINIWTLSNYTSIISDPIFSEMLLNSFKVSLLTTILALLISYPAAYALAKKLHWFKLAFLWALIIPLFISVNIRVFGWTLFLVKQGILTGLLQIFGYNLNSSLMYTEWTIILGTTYVYLPFMLFPIYLSIITIPDSLITAAEDLGANRFKIFRDIILPLSVPGVVIGSLFVSVLSLGAEIETSVLGGGKIITLANNITHEFGFSQNWGLGSALAVFLLIGATVAGITILRMIDLKEIAARGE